MKKLFLLLLILSLLIFSTAVAECQGVLISEVLSGNTRDDLQDVPRYADAVRITNTGEHAEDLSGWHLSDSKKKTDKYTFPSVVLEPGKSIVIACNKDGGTGVAQFGVSSDGERIYLSNQEGKIIDALKVPALPPNVSYGRGVDGRLLYFSSFGGNGLKTDGEERIAEKPVTNLPSGGYSDGISVELIGEQPIFYTLDGSIPTKDSMLYTEPLHISDNTLLRAISAPKGSVASSVQTMVYRFDTKDYSLSTVTVVAQPEGLKKLAKNRMDKDLEVPAHVTCLSPDGEIEFSLGCGLAYSGQTSRSKEHHGWKLVFRSRFGAEALNTQVFPESEQKSFSSLLLRVGTRDLYPYPDLLAAAIGKGTMPSVLCQNRRPVILFINHEYWGIYYLRENIGQEFVAARLGGSKDNADIIYRGDILRKGDDEEWKELLTYCKTHDLSCPENYTYVTSKVNPESFIDYYIWRPYLADYDSSNYQVVRSRNAKDSRWHMVIYDMDWAFWDQMSAEISMNYYTYRRQSGKDNNNQIISSLLQNEKFRNLFLTRFAWHMNNTFQPERLNKLLDEEVRMVQPDLPRHLNRWNMDERSWRQNIQKIRDFIKCEGYDRRKILINETRSYFGLNDSTAKELFGYDY